jgi:hypothetical protein
MFSALRVCNLGVLWLRPSASNLSKHFANWCGRGGVDLRAWWCSWARAGAMCDGWAVVTGAAWSCPRDGCPRVTAAAWIGAGVEGKT